MLAEFELLTGTRESGSVRLTGSRQTDASNPRLVSSSKKQRILDTILETVGEDGYESTSVRVVLERTGLYRQAFYDNFIGKEDCFLQAYEEALGRLEARVRAAARGADAWPDQLRLGLASLLGFLDVEPNVSRALIVEVHAAGAGPMARRGEALRGAKEFLERAERLGSESPPAIAAEGVVAGIHSVLHSRLATGGGNGFRELLPELVYFAMLPYFGPETAAEAMRAAR